MNKFLAMLKDAYREAVDGWIFLVMLVLSGIIILLVLSCSVEPLPTDRGISTLLNTQSIYAISANRGEAEQQIPCFFRFNSAFLEYEENKEPWKSKIRMTLKARVALPKQGSADMSDDGMQAIETQDAVAMMVFKETVRYWNSSGSFDFTAKPYSNAVGEEFLKKQISEGTGLNVTSVTIAGDNKFVIEADGMKRASDWPHKPTLFFGAYTMEGMTSPLGSLVYLIESKLLNGIGAWVLMLTGVIVTAGFIPNMLRKGAIDLFITKPISRPMILIYKYLGGLLFVFLLTALTVGGVWLAIGIRTGVWTTGIFIAIPGITFYFAILYACSTLIGVLTRNTIVCIIGTIVFWFVLFVIGLVYNGLAVLDKIDYDQLRKAQASAKAMTKESEKMKDDANKDKGKDGEKEKKDEKKTKKADADDAEFPDLKPNATLMSVFRNLNTLTPRLNDLDALTSQAIANGLVPEGDYKQKEKAANNVKWGEAIVVSCGWLVIFLGLATLRFVTRSY